MDIRYNNSVVSGQFLTPQETIDNPIVSLSGLDTNKEDCLIMYDPNGVAGNHIHWIVDYIPGNNFNEGIKVFEYKQPTPPKGSGIHNYVFSLYESSSNKQIYNMLNDNNRTIELDYLLVQLNITGEPIYTKKFISEYREGGSKTRIRTKTKRRKVTKRYKIKGRRTNKRHKVIKNHTNKYRKY